MSSVSCIPSELSLRAALGATVNAAAADPTNNWRRSKRPSAFLQLMILVIVDACHSGGLLIPGEAAHHNEIVSPTRRPL
jgi:hypothetical protein